MEKLTLLEEYLGTLGLDDRATAKVLTKKNAQRSLDAIQRKVADYQLLLQVDEKTLGKLLTKFPAMLSYDTNGDSPTSIKNKIKEMQAILHTDDKTVAKMVISLPSLFGFDITGNSATSLRGKIKAYQTVLKTDEATVRKMMIAMPSLIGCEIIGDSPASITNKLKFLKSSFQVDDRALTQMLVKAPVLLALDAVGDGPKSLATKINKFKQLMPLDQLREHIAYNPALLTVPAQAIKIRYMLAEDIGLTSVFLQKGFLTSQSKVWARACYMSHLIRGVFKMNNIYREESTFNHTFGVKSADLMKRYPLDQAAVHKIETTYLRKTGNLLTLDQQERAVLGLGK